MIRRPIPAWLFYTLGVTAILIAVAFYSGLSIRQTRINPDQNVFPNLKSFANGIKEMTQVRGGENNPKPSWISVDLRATYWRLFLGLSAGVVCSMVVGIAMGAYPAAEAFFNPTITFFSKIPPTAMLAVYMVVFGIHLKMYIAMIAFGVFFTMAQSIYQAVKKDVAADHIDKAYTLGASEVEVIVEVIWPQVLPRMIENLRLQLGPAMVFLIAAEWSFASEGFGYTIRQQSKLQNMHVVYIYLAILGFSGLMFDWLLLQLRRRLCPWFGE